MVYPRIKIATLQGVRIALLSKETVYRLCIVALFLSSALYRPQFALCGEITERIGKHPTEQLKREFGAVS